LQVINLEFSDRGITGIDIFPLFDQGLGEFLPPGLRQLLGLLQGRLDLIGSSQILAFLELLVERAQSFIHVVDFPRVAAQQIVAQKEAVLHHLRSDTVRRVLHGERFLGRLLGRDAALDR
jgi:hypothetical protein